MGSTGLSQLLRGALGIAGGIGFVLALAAIGVGEPVGAAWLLIVSAVLILVALYEQGRYRDRAEDGGSAPAGGVSVPGQPVTPGWGVGPAAGSSGATLGGVNRSPAGLERTDEVFADPTTGTRLRVWFDPRTGERRYVPEP